MAWPKKNTRTVVVEGMVYQWHLDPAQSLWRWIVIRKKSAEGQLLFLDPYWLSTTPGQICQAIIFALSTGWNPHRKLAPLKLGSKLMAPKTFAFEFYLLSEDATPGRMPWTLGAGSLQLPVIVSEPAVLTGLIDNTLDRQHR